MFARPAGAEEELDDEWRREQKGESENTRRSQEKEEKESRSGKVSHYRVEGYIDSSCCIATGKCISE